MPTTPNRGYQYPSENDPALIPHDVEVFLTAIDADMQGNIDELDGKTDTTDPRLSDARPPTAHTHEITDVDGLQAALNGKTDTTDPRLSDARPPTAHTHDLGDVTGLAARLAALEYRSGRRDITSLLSPAPTSGKLYIERRGDTVWLHMDALNLATTSDTIYSSVIASGFQIVSPAEIPAAQRSVLDARGGLRTYGSSLGFYYLGQTAGPFRGMVSWPTNQAIPTTLPGTPA